MNNKNESLVTIVTIVGSKVRSYVNQFNSLKTQDGKELQYKALVGMATSKHEIAQIQAAGIETGAFDPFKDQNTGEKLSYAEMRARYG